MCAVSILILRLIFDVCSINIAFNTKQGNVVSTYVCWEILLFVGSKLPWIWWPNQPTNKYQTALTVWFRLTETTQNNEHSFYIFCSIILIYWLIDWFWVGEWVSEWVQRQVSSSSASYIHHENKFTKTYVCWKVALWLARKRNI